MHRYWFEFEDSTDAPLGVRLGCGVTAYDYQDAINILAEEIFLNRELPRVLSAREDIEVHLLDQSHVVPNMGNVTKRGVWFPLGYE